MCRVGFRAAPLLRGSRTHPETGRALHGQHTHPFRRIWRWGVAPLELEAPYFARGPFQTDRSDEVDGAAPGSIPSYEFHWTVSDYVSAMLAAGCRLLALEEMGDGLEEWENAPLEGLPLYLLLVGRKE